MSSAMNYTTVIGMEVHVQLTTSTKIFCTCANEISKTPNCMAAADNSVTVKVLLPRRIDSSPVLLWR